MGEVIEINTVGSDLLIYNKLISFWESIIKGQVLSTKIETMDNWQYENIVELKSLSDIRGVIEQKIVLIKLKFETHIVGVTIEKQYNKYIVEGWLNSQLEVDEQRYKEIINKFISTFRSYKINSCCIGREIIVDDYYDISEAIEKSHNVDVWIVRKKEYRENARKTRPLIVYFDD